MTLIVIVQSYKITFYVIYHLIFLTHSVIMRIQTNICFLKGVISLNKLQGIYGIYNTVKQKWYVGQSHNIRARISQHKSNLNCGTHHCREMQADYNNGDTFEYYALRLNVAEDDLDLAEKLYIEELCYSCDIKGYNKFPIYIVDEEYDRKAFELVKIGVSAADAFSIIITMKAFARLKDINISTKERRKLVLKEIENTFDKPFALD